MIASSSPARPLAQASLILLKAMADDSTSIYMRSGNNFSGSRSFVSQVKGWRRLVDLGYIVYLDEDAIHPRYQLTDKGRNFIRNSI